MQPAIRAAVRVEHAPESFRGPFDILVGDRLLRSERVEFTLPRGRVRDGLASPAQLPMFHIPLAIGPP